MIYEIYFYYYYLCNYYYLCYFGGLDYEELINVKVVVDSLIIC